MVHRIAALGILGLVVAACAVPATPELSELAAEALSPNPCTKVVMTAPAQGFVAPAGVPVVLTGAATCPAGQTPEYQYWVKQFNAPNWTILGPHVPGSTTWIPPSEDRWCVTVVVRAIGAPEGYQARASSKCSTPRCGNHVIDPGEQCDDGNASNGDGCDANCTLPSCGNTILDAGEECDDGNVVDGDACEADCTIPRCGNATLDPGEACDDGNAINGDGCDTNCTIPACGNGALDPGEECDDGNAENGDACDANCTTPRCGNGAVDPGEQCDDGNADNTDACDTSCAIRGFAYLKASNANANDNFGTVVVLSADGTTLAVGAFREASAASGVNGDQGNNAVADAGAVYVFTRSGGVWSQQAYLKASNTDPDRFGWSLALSSDGSTLAVGAPDEASTATGIDGDQHDNSGDRVGAVYVFQRSGTTWTQQAYVKAADAGSPDKFGWSVAISGDGSTLAVGAILAGEPPAALCGEVYLFTRSGATWTQQAVVAASNPSEGASFGWSVALSTDATTLAVGARFESSASTGIDGDQTGSGAGSSGAAYVFRRSGAAWPQEAYVKASNTGAQDQFGYSVALSADGATLAVGAIGEASGATGIGGNQGDNTASASGAVYLFARTSATWAQQAYVKASNTDALDQFGYSVALSADGNTLASGAFTEASGAVGLDGDQADNSTTAAGAAYLFTRSATQWAQDAYVKATNTGFADLFGASVALTADGATLVVGAATEWSAATGIDGDQSNNAATGAGAVYVYRVGQPH